MTAKSKKPLLYGDKTFDAQRLDEIDALEENWDWSYVPGFSEQRRENERLVAAGKAPVPIPNLYWTRVGGIDGTGDVDHRQRVNTQRLGYQACTPEDLKEHGWEMPPAAYVGSDGLIRRDDLALAIVDFDRAQKNRKRREENAKVAPRAAGDVIESFTHVDGRVNSLADAERVFAEADKRETKR